VIQHIYNVTSGDMRPQDNFVRPAAIFYLYHGPELKLLVARSATPHPQYGTIYRSLYGQLAHSIVLELYFVLICTLPHSLTDRVTAAPRPRFAFHWAT
jgi:uncharacterized membrane protein